MTASTPDPAEEGTSRADGSSRDGERHGDDEPARDDGRAWADGRAGDDESAWDDGRARDVAPSADVELDEEPAENAGAEGGDVPPPVPATSERADGVPPPLVEPAAPAREEASSATSPLGETAASAAAPAAPRAAVSPAAPVPVPAPAASSAASSAAPPAAAAAAPAADASAGAASPGAATAAAPRVVYVDAPTPPRERGNRGFGILLAIIATVVFAALLTLAAAALSGREPVDQLTAFLGSIELLAPVPIFLVAFLVLVLLVNRAGWWAFVLGSLLVGLVVYLGSALVALGVHNAFARAPDEVVRSFGDAAREPLLLVAGVLAREIVLWTGALVSRRGRAVRERNAREKEQFEQEQSSARERAVTPAA